MLKLFARLALLIAGAVVLIDALLPHATLPARIDRHFSASEPSPVPRSRFWDTSYHVQMTGGSRRSCDVGYAAYSALHDGDTVRVTSSRLLGLCLRIERGSEPVYEARYWTAFQVGFGLVLLAAAVGWLRTNEDGEFAV